MFTSDLTLADIGFREDAVDSNVQFGADEELARASLSAFR